jgi:hypothetical protein
MLLALLLPSGRLQRTVIARNSFMLPRCSRRYRGGKPNVKGGNIATILLYNITFVNELLVTALSIRDELYQRMEQPFRFGRPVQECGTYKRAISIADTAQAVHVYSSYVVQIQAQPPAGSGNAVIPSCCRRPSVS